MISVTSPAQVKQSRGNIRDHVQDGLYWRRALNVRTNTVMICALGETTTTLAPTDIKTSDDAAPKLWPYRTLLGKRRNKDGVEVVEVL